MKKKLFLLMAGFLGLSTVAGISISTKATQVKADSTGLVGSGTKEDPYQIASKADMFTFHDIVEGANGQTQNVEACAILTNNIDLEGDEWEPIGQRKAEEEIMYLGIFDGRGHTIDNFSITQFSGYGMGLFAYTGGNSIVRNLKIYGEINVSSGTYVGVFAGVSTGSFYNCENNANIIARSYVGGIVGAAALYEGREVATLKIDKCCNLAGEIRGMSNVGGILGSSASGYSGEAKVTNCYNEGEIYVVSGMLNSSIGGIVGKAELVANCHSVGQMHGDASYTGGIAGSLLDGATFTNCYYLEDTAEKAIGSETADVPGQYESLTSFQMKSKSNFANWDFFDVWKETTVYPSFNYTEYGVYIGDLHVDSGHTEGEHWSYDYWSNTLTLDNFVASGEGTTGRASANGYITFDSERPLNIVLKGINSLTNTAEAWGHGIFTFGDLTISGDGSLIVTATNSIYSSYGIECRGSLTINGGSITTVGGPTTGYNSSIGVTANKGIVVNGGKLIAIGGLTENGSSDGIYYNSVGLTVGADSNGVIACGNTYAIRTNINSALDGAGYTNIEGTEEKTALSAGSYEFEDINTFKYIKFTSISAEDVIALINNIGTVTYPDSEAPIAAARDAYDSLDESQKLLVTNYSVLEAAEEAWATLKADHDKAKAVEDLITALPNPSDVALSDEIAINNARSEYDKLTETQKSYVPNYTKLTNDEIALQAIKDQIAADYVKGLISAIPTPVTLDSEDEIVAARNAFDALTSTQQALVTNLGDLINAELALDAIKDQLAADIVMELINSIPSPVTLDSEDEIVAAREAYDDLTVHQKTLVLNYDKLEEAEIALQDIKDQIAADAVEALIEAIGEVKYNSESKEKIDAAREGYDALSRPQKELVENYSVLTADEERYNHVDAVAKQIDAIGDVTLKSGDALKAAQDAYDALSEEEKSLIPGFYEALKIKENTYTELVNKHKTGVTLGIVFGVIGGVILLICGAWALMMFVFNKWIRREDKAVRVIKLWKVKDGKVLTTAFFLKFEKHLPEDIYNSKEEALK